MRDPYAVLGVPKTASAGEIKSAYRKAAKTWHPDRNPDDARAKERFSELSRAYEIIGDADKRAKFDRGEIDADGRETFRGMGGGPGGGFAADGFEDLFGGRARGARGRAGGLDAEDILNTMFSGAFGPGGARRGSGFENMFGDPPQGANRAARKPAKGRDIEVRLVVTLEDAIAASKVKLALPDGRSVAVQVPAGVEDGQVIRLKGQGIPVAGGEPGDVLAKVQLRPGPSMRVEGRTILADLDVPLAVAVTGGKVPLATPDGRIALKVPAWSSSGQTLRVAGRGLPDKTGKRGDLLAVLRIVLDDNDRARLTALYGAPAN